MYLSGRGTSCPRSVRGEGTGRLHPVWSGPVLGRGGSLHPVLAGPVWGGGQHGKECGGGGVVIKEFIQDFKNNYRVLIFYSFLINCTSSF